MTLNIEEIEEILEDCGYFIGGTLPDYFTYIANNEEEAKEMTEEIIVDGKNYGQDIEGAELTEEEKNVFRRMTELKKKTDMTAIEQSELDKLMNEFIRIKIAHATASDEEVNNFIKREKGSRGKIQLTKKEVKKGVKEMARLKQSLNRLYVAIPDDESIMKVLSVNGGKIELREIEKKELKKICDNNNIYYFNEKKFYYFNEKKFYYFNEKEFYYFNEKELIDKPVKETYNIDDKLFFRIINDINKNGDESDYLRKNENGISMAYTVLKYCFEKNIIKIDGKYNEGGFISYIYEKNINIDNDAFIKILCEVGDYNSVMFLIKIFSIQNYEKKNTKDYKEKSIQKYEEEIFFSGCPETIHLFERYCKVTSKALEGACKAVNDNNVGVIKYLLSNYDWKYIDLIKAYNSIKDPRMAEPIFEEIKSKIENKKEIKELIEERVEDEKTVLHYAAKNGNLEIFRLILENLSEQEKKELIKKKDRYKRKTVLHYATIIKKPEIFKLILENLSEQDRKELIKEKDKDRDGETLFHYVIKQKNSEIVKLILDCLNHREKLELIKEKDEFGRTAFHRTIENGNLEIVKLILENLNEQEIKELIKEKDEIELTALHYAAESKNLKIVKLILENLDEQERKELIKEKDEDGQTALHYAVSNKNLEIVKLLLENLKEERKKLIKEKDGWEKTVLHYATEKRNLEIVKLILENLSEQERKELIKEKDEDGRTALHYAIKSKKPKIVELLLENLSEQEKKELIKEKDGDGRTAFDYAHKYNSLEIYNFLQNLEKNITIEDNKPTEEEYNNIIDANDNLEKNEDLEMFDKTSKSIDEIDDEQQNSEVSVERSNG